MSEQIQQLIEVKEGICRKVQEGTPQDGDLAAMYALRALMKDKLSGVVT